ncbi:hypothetical protein GAYE_SCF48G5965 [Galdieria yellowstonensis]|uniref:Uncharacterized protein n=1 Tax=Galdieria yellowstonensis TaxID=3028027 RepID=A0AAV9ILI9_9RHOD|nr:hypothetical protein GAYE_SCF48G5965 [Galdieria yellowstonensis]
MLLVDKVANAVPREDGRYLKTWILFKPVLHTESLRSEYQRLYALNSNRKSSRQSSHIHSCENAEYSFRQLEEIDCSPFLENSDISSFLPVRCSISIGSLKDMTYAFESCRSCRTSRNRSFSKAHLSVASSYQKFLSILSVRVNTEDKFIFPILLDRVPGITESYTVDHFMEGKELSTTGCAI